MAALAPYIPARDAAFSNWFLNFETLIAANPGRYGLTSGDATAITAQYTTWSAAYALVTSPSTKTATTVQAKNADKVTALALVRPYAQTIALNAGVAASDKVALGLNPRTSTPTPITAPTTNPVLTIQSTSTAGSIVRYRDATASPSVKSKPYGVTQILIYATASATAITDPALLTLNTIATKSPLTVVMGSANAGKTVYFAARWSTRKGLFGPWSPIVSYVVAG